MFELSLALFARDRREFESGIVCLGSGSSYENGTGDEWLKIGVLKGMVDGALGSHTAAMFEPFEDTPDDSGFFILDEDSLYEWSSAADAAGLQLAVHAIGDRAINTLLNTFERIASENGPRDRRFRIEHAQHPTAEDIERFATLGVIPSMQPYHAIDDGRWAESVIGPGRAKTTYAFRSFLDAGAMLAFGSDWAVRSLRRYDCKTVYPSRAAIFPASGFGPHRFAAI